MNTTPQKKTSEQTVAAIFALDLEPIKTKLMDKTEGQGWTRAQVDHYELEYKRFLALLARFPNETIAPNKEVDKFWHGHILDTMKYAEDCNKVFGFFLHHYPYFGMRGEEDAANLAKAFVNMQRLHQQEFGDEIPSVEKQQAAWCGAASVSDQQAAWCGAAAVQAESAAWCGAASVSDQQAAWCGAAAVQAESAAWCGAAASSDIGAEQQPAWCGAAAGDNAIPLERQAAWCGAAAAPRTIAEQEAAWCGAVAQSHVEQGEKNAAWCGAAVSVSAEKAAWCGAVSGSRVETEEKNVAWCGAVQARA